MTEKKEEEKKPEGPVLIRNGAGAYTYCPREVAEKLLRENKKKRLNAEGKGVKKEEWPKEAYIVKKDSKEYAEAAKKAEGKDYDTKKGDKKS